MDRRSDSPGADMGYRYKMKRRDDRDRDSRDYGRNRRSRSRSRSRERYGRMRRSRSRSRSRERSRNHSSSYESRRRQSNDRDLYKDMISDDYHGERGEKGYYSHRERDRRERDGRNRRRSYSPEPQDNDDDSHDSDWERYTTAIPYNKIIVRGLAQHITEADITSDLMQCGLKPLSIRLIRRKKTGASRGFAFVEFSTEQEATQWMDIKQVSLVSHMQNNQPDENASKKLLS